MYFRLFAFITVLLVAIACKPAVGTIEVVAEMKENPGNLTVSADGRVFASVHQFRGGAARLVEVGRDGSMTPWPNAAWNALPDAPDANKDAFQSVLGVQIDQKGRLWALDNGLGPNPRAPRLFAFNLENGQLEFGFEFPGDVAAPGSFLNDLAVDAQRGFVYIADIGGATKPGIVVVDVNGNRSYRYDEHESFPAEDLDIVVEGRVMHLPGPDGQPTPARIGINPITLSADNEVLYYGAMSGKTWYRMPAGLLREGADAEKVHAAIQTEGPKAISDGASTDADGRHYFTNLGNNSIDILEGGKTTTLAKDDKLLLWPDALSFGESGWLYVAVNQLHNSPPLNGGQEGAKGPFYILRIYTGTEGIAGR